MSQFTFLQREWGAVFDAASKAEAAVRADRHGVFLRPPRTGAGRELGLQARRRS